jgi:hypothetical protein
MSPAVSWADMTLPYLATGVIVGSPLLVLVIVIAIGGVTVPVVLIVDMVAVADGLMPAAWPVSVLVAGVGQVGQRMLVVVAGMLGVGMAFVKVVDVTLALHAGMPAAWPMCVLMWGMDFMVGDGHGSSLL